MAGYFRTLKMVATSKLFSNNRLVQPTFQQPVCGIKRDLIEKRDALNIPEKPKRPLTPYIQYINEIREQLKKDHPNASVVEIIKLSASKWKALPEEDKDKYQKKFNAEIISFNEKIAKYNASLTSDQKEVLDELKAQEKSDKKRREIRKENKELEKPVRPLGPYNLYLQEKSKQSNKGINVLLQELKGVWGALPEEEKEKYRYQYKKEKEKYDKELKAWEEKMIQEGKKHLVRVATLEEKRPAMYKIILDNSKKIKSKPEHSEASKKTGSKTEKKE